MKKADLLSILIAVTLLAVAVIAEAQQPKKVFRIGYLSLSVTPTSAPRRDAFRQGLGKLGYAEGKDFVIENLNAESFDRLSELAAELVRRKVDIIVTAGPGPTRAAKAATSTIPIVMRQAPIP